MDNLPALVEQQENLQYITFQAGEELFGVNIHCVEEILLPPKITGIPRTPDYFLGITNLRGEVVSVIDLRVRFGLDSIGQTEDSRIIVIMSQGIKLGMYVDRVSSIVSIVASEIKLPPPIIATEKQKYITGSFKTTDNTILLLLDHGEIISNDDFIIPSIDIDGTSVLAQVEVEEEKEIVNEIHMAGFSMGREFYAIGGLSVEEIIEKPKVTVVPEMESFVEGIFHLRESVIPIIKLSKRLGLKQEVDINKCPVIIVKVAGVKVGLIVEKITEVFLVKETDIVAPPSNLNKGQTEQLNGIIKLNRDDKTRVVMVLNLDNLFSLDEKELLQQLDEKVSSKGNEAEEEEEEHEDKIPVLEFMIGTERFAIPLFESNEIIPVREIVPVPKAPPFIRGVINLRGTVMSIIDLPCLINATPCKITKDTKILIVNPADDETIGMLVDNLIGISQSIFEPPSEFVTQKGNAFIQGMGKDENTGEIIILLDLFQTYEESQQYETSENDEAAHLLTAENFPEIEQVEE